MDSSAIGGSAVTTDADISLAVMRSELNSLIARVTSLESNQRWAVLAVGSGLVAAVMNLVLK